MEPGSICTADDVASELWTTVRWAFRGGLIVLERSMGNRMFIDHEGRIVKCKNDRRALSQ